MRIPVHILFYDTMVSIWGRDLVASIYVPISTVQPNLCGRSLR